MESTRQRARTTAVSKYLVLIAVIAFLFVLGGCPNGSNIVLQLIAPSNLTLEAMSAIAVRVTWGDDNEHETGFIVERRASSEGGFFEVATVESDVTEFDDYGLDASTAYQYRVCAIDSTGRSDYTSIISITTPSPAFSGFDFVLETGDFWDFRWDSLVLVQGYGDEYFRGALRAELGNPATIAGITGYELLLYGSVPDFADIRWQYLGTVGNRFIGSADGSTWEIILDGDAGYWAGGGFFIVKSPDMISSAGSGTIDNDYINASAILVGASNSSNDCTSVPGYGTVCGGGGYTGFSKHEYYLANVGPAGYRFHYSEFSWSWEYEDEENIGLIAASLRGDDSVITPEIEPNEYTSTESTQPISIGQIIAGEVQEDDTIGQVYVVVGPGPWATRTFHDSYIVTTHPKDHHRLHEASACV